MEWFLSHFCFSSYSLRGDEIKSTSTETEPVVSMIFLHKEIRCGSWLILFPDQLFKMAVFSHMIKNNFTKCDFTIYYKIRDKFQNNLLPAEMNFRRISAVTKNRNRFSCQKVLKWKNTSLFKTYYFVLNYISFIVILIPELHP